MIDAADDRQLSGTRRAAGRCLAVGLVLLAVAAGAGLLAQARAERLLREGVPSTAVVLEQRTRGKSTFVRLARPDGRELEVRVGAGPGDYPPGSRVRLLSAGGDVRTEREWNTPPHLLAPAVLGTGFGLGLLVVAAVLAQHVRSTRRRLAVGQWRAVVPDGRRLALAGGTVELPDVVWPVPASVEVLDEPPRRTVLVRLPGGDHLQLRRGQARSSTSTARDACGGGTAP